jgi:hypothetical protein
MTNSFKSKTLKSAKLAEYDADDLLLAEFASEDPSPQYMKNF